MERGISCGSCGVRNELHERLCRACGNPIGGGVSIPPASTTALRLGHVIRHRGLAVRWILLGSIVTLGICGLTVVATIAIAGHAAFSAHSRGVDDADAVTSLIVTVASGFLLSFFLGGVVVGRLSAGRTIVEPALSAGIAIVALMAIGGAFDQGAMAILCTSPVLSLLALLGAWLGEKWQDAATPGPRLER